MGCDGGTIPRRDELVRLRKKPETVKHSQFHNILLVLPCLPSQFQKDKESERFYRWRHCALSQQKLQQPIVMCGLGRLYSKQNVIEQLLEKDGMPESCSHIKSLKDIKNLKLTANPAYSAEEDKNAPFVCALIGLEMSGQFRFVAPWTCGCVFSERALKEISKSSVCSMCQTPYTEQDIVILNGNEKDVDLMTTKMEARAARLKAEKRDKKNKNKIEATATSTTAVEPETLPSTSEVTVKIEPGTSSSKLKPTSKSSLFVCPSLAAQKREIITDVIGPDPNCKKAKKDYSVAKDPKATEVYKSIFTSHESEQSQDRAHWITYNPFYN